MDEISVLDYLKFKLNPKNFGKEILPEENPAFDVSGDASEDGESPRPVSVSLPEKWLAGKELLRIRLNPFFFVLSLILAAAAQIVLEPTIMTRTRLIPWLGGGLYLLCALSFAVSYFFGAGNGEEPESPVEAEPDEDGPVFASSVRYEFLCLSAVCALLAFLLFGGNRFSFINVTVWILSLVFAGLAFSSRGPRELIGTLRDRITGCLRDRPRLKIEMTFLGIDTAWTYIVQGIVIVVAIALDIRKYIAKK